MKKIICNILIACLFISCEEVINLDLPERAPRLVVDGLITNDTASYSIKLTKTSKYTYPRQK